MKNVDRLALYVTKHGADSLLIHTIPQTTNWLICQRIDKDLWSITLCNPIGNMTYNLGTVTKKQHLAIWMHLTKLNIEYQTSQRLLARQLKRTIKNFKKIYEQDYAHFLKKGTDQKEQKTNKTKRKNISKNPKKLAKTIHSKIHKKNNSRQRGSSTQTISNTNY